MLDASGTTALPAAGQSVVFLDSPRFSTQLTLEPLAQYLIGVVNTNPAYPISEDFTLAGALVSGAGEPAMALATAPSPNPEPPRAAAPRTYRLQGPEHTGLPAIERSAGTHLQTLERNRQIYAWRGSPERTQARLRGAGPRLAPLRARIAQTIGTVNKVYVPNSPTGGRADVDSIGVRTVAVGQHVIVLADTSRARWPDRDRPDSGFYQTFADEYDQITWPHLESYVGDPLAYDASLSGTGKVTVTITPALNNLDGGVPGLVNLCDFFPFVGSGPDANYSNETEMFYSWTPGTSTLRLTFWRKLLRAVAAHESKHIVSFASRIVNHSPVLEEVWLEEGLAQLSEEIWLRHFNNARWKSHAVFNDTVACELDLGIADPCWGDNPIGLVVSHFPFLFMYLEGETGNAEGSGKDVPAIYGAGWAIARWAADQYAADEAGFVRSLVNEPQLSSLANLSRHTGQPIPLLLVYWNLATAIFQQTPVDKAADPRIIIPSFNLWNIYWFGQTQLTCGGTRCGLFTESGRPVWPLVPPPLVSGNFARTVTGLPGTGASFFLLTASERGTQALQLWSGSGRPIGAASGLRVAFVRVR